MSRYLDPVEPAGFPWKKLVLIVFVAGLCFVLGAGAGLILLANFGDFPPIGSAAAYRPSVTSKIFDRNNRVVGEIYLEKRNVVPFETIPTHVVNAFVWPGGATDGPPLFSTSRGFQTAHWSEGGMTHWVISDASRQEFGAVVTAIESTARQR